MSATGYGLSPILVRIGLEGKGLAVSVAGNLVASLAATVVMGLFLLPPRQLAQALSVGREPAKWFTLSGILVAVSQLFLYMAMSIAPVTVVSPINRLSILFRLYFSRLLNPQHEVFGGEVVLGTIVSLAGAAVLSLSIELGAVLAATAGGRPRGFALALALRVGGVGVSPLNFRCAAARIFSAATAVFCGNVVQASDK